MVPNVAIFLIWFGACVFLQVDHVNAVGRCRFPFNYKGKEIYDCTTMRSSQAWCSLDRVYKGNWKYCTDDDYAKCYFPFTYNGKKYRACTTDGNVSTTKPWCALTSSYDAFKRWSVVTLPIAMDSIKPLKQKCRKSRHLKHGGYALTGKGEILSLQF